LQIESKEKEILETVNSTELLDGLMRSLSEREMLAIKKYYFDEETFQSIADYFDISHQRAKQIVSEAIQKMKKKAQIRGVR
jgi:RNA polymerase sigma factor (sigma-70 family)